MDEIASIKSEIESLTTRLAALELENESKQETQSGGDPVSFGTDESSPIEIAKLRAFDVTCDGRENDPWLIYLPDGCISYAGFEPDEIDPAPDATTRLADLGTAIKNGGIYAHLYLELDDDSDSDSSTEPEIVGFQRLEIDTTPALTPTEDNIKIVNIKIATITDGAISQNVSSSLILGGEIGNKGDAAPLPWDVKVENGNAYVFSPVIYVVEGGSGGKFRTHTKVIPSGCTENSWNRVGLNAHDNISCALAVSVSGSGSRSYVASLTGGLPTGSYAELTFFRVAKFQIDASLAPLKVLQQYVHGEQVFLDFGSQDRRSISLNEDGETEIKGFKSQASETSKLAQHLTADSEFDGQVLVRITDQQGKKQLVYMPIGNGIGGGGGGTTGYTGTINVPTGNMRCNAASGYYIQNEFKTWTFENGLLKSVGNAQWPTSGGLATTPLSGT